MKTTTWIWLFIGAGLIGVYFAWRTSISETWAPHLDSLFSGFAFVGLIGTIFLQMEELRETQRQLAKSAAAQVESERALREQLKSMDRTALINSFAAMLHYYATEGSMKYDSSQQAKAIKNILGKMTDDLRRESKQSEGDSGEPQTS